MKKILALAVAMFALTSLSAQTGAVNYYGVDFSNARAFGAAEAGFQFRDAFAKINSLVVAEWPKYDPGKFLGMEVAVRDISATVRVNGGVDVMKIDTSSSDYRLSPEDIVGMVAGYELAETEGTGFVIITGLLDKSTATGTFYLVWFDVASREVLEFRETAGKARGFGLRNYWAGALHDALKAVRLMTESVNGIYLGY